MLAVSALAMSFNPTERGSIDSAIYRSKTANCFFFLIERSFCGFRPIKLTLPTAEKQLSANKTRPKEANCNCENGDEHAARY